MTKNAVRVFAIALAVVLLDGVFKYLAIHYFAPDSEPLSTPFALALHKNPGITFDIAVPLAIVVPLTIIILIFLSKIAWQARHTRKQQAMAAVVVIIGALGNLLDRIINGFTTDYLIFFARSAINLSDVLIVTGAIALMYYTERNSPVTGAKL